MAKPPVKQLKVGLRIRDLDRSFDLRRRLGFRHLPVPAQAQLRYLTYGRTWLILLDLTKHGYHHAEHEHQTKQGPVGLGFVIVVPTADLDATWTLWRDEGLHRHRNTLQRTKTWKESTDPDRVPSPPGSST